MVLEQYYRETYQHSIISYIIVISKVCDILIPNIDDRVTGMQQSVGIA